MEENENLVKENDNESKKQKKISTIYKIVTIIVVIGIFALSAVGLIISFTIKREKKSDSKDDKSLYELNTVPSKGMEEARKIFNQYLHGNNSKNME